MLLHLRVQVDVVFRAKLQIANEQFPITSNASFVISRFEND